MGPDDEQATAPTRQPPEPVDTEVYDGFFERLMAPGGVVDQTWMWVEFNWLNLMSGVPAIVATLFLVEFTKGWVKLLAAHKLGENYTDAWETLIVRTWTAPCAFVWVATLDFTTSWNQMTGGSLDWWQGMLLGTTMTTGIALGIVWAIDWFEVAETARVKFRNSRFGVSKQRLEGAKTGVHEIPDGLGDEEE